MNKYLRGESNYDKRPVIKVKDPKHVCLKGWELISQHLFEQVNKVPKEKKVIVFECYQGVIDTEIISALQERVKGSWLFSKDYMLPENEIDSLVYPDVTDDEVFGYMTRLNLKDFFAPRKLKEAEEIIGEKKGTVIVYGCGASILHPDPDLLIYIDMARWEIQQRFRKNEVSNLGACNKELKASLQYKRAFFVDWRVCDRLKKQLMNRWDFVVDTNVRGQPKMVSAEDLRAAYRQIVTRPFRVVPFFDPGPWGGQWMKEYCDLDRTVENFAWCFDCVPEENSLFLQFGNVIFETPSINLVFYQSEKLLGTAVQARFGDEFPIRFDFLDTMSGGNLSLQVHPTTEYIQDKFGMHYTQDESYYIMDAADDACVYLGFKDDISSQQMIWDLNRSQEEENSFDADKYVVKWRVKKHDHVSIPAGTIHCSGANSMVLEISATPYIFTFKLWDWNRMGLDGKPRPINIEHGQAVMNWSRTEAWVKKELVNTIQMVDKGEGWVEERTGLHEREFIETRRHWFNQKVYHQTHGSVNVLNLVEGREAVIESPSQAFDPFIVHYAETFIIPEAVKEYTITPYGESEGKQCATIKAFVR
ncbi:MAG TPA: class I mannose-6-phosphate isomerase, partial [Chitinophagaceae bacterium]|nr:class I mannose-6-phosphate isomerase [Chitinophagaceae bacterium]